jgi:hypothetical protein
MNKNRITKYIQDVFITLVIGRYDQWFKQRKMMLINTSPPPNSLKGALVMSVAVLFMGFKSTAAHKRALP